MYSVVLMMAISGGAEAPDFGHRCSGCSCSGYVSCHRSHGCHSSCHGGLFSRRCHGCHSTCHSSCHSSCHGCHGGLFRRHHCHGCTGCSAPVCTGCTGGVIYGPGGGTMGGTTGGGVIIEKKEMPKGGEKKTSAPATIVVNVPADARVTIDGASTSQTSARRTFVTPELDLNSDYVYTFRAEVVRDGRPVVETLTVTVRGGATTEVPFSFSSTGVASR